MRNYVTKNNAPIESNRKVTVAEKVLKVEWDGIEEEWFSTGGGFKRKNIKKTVDGDHYLLEYELGPGMHFGYILPNLKEVEKKDRKWPETDKAKNGIWKILDKKVEEENVAKKFKEVVPKIANGDFKKGYVASAATKMFKKDKDEDSHKYLVYKNNDSKENNKKLIVVEQAEAKDWDGIEPQWFHTAGGFDLASVKKEATGSKYKIEFELGPGQ